MYLGIDIGTSSIKSVLIDEEQKILVSATSEISVSRPHDGWSEQDPEQWITATKQTLNEIKASHADELAATSAIGLSGQMHGATLLGANDKPLRDCILWNDGRSSSQAAALDNDPDFRRISGNIVFPGFTAPKLVWVKENEPSLFDAIKTVLLPKDYVRLWLTGELVGDMSDASGTSWLDVGNRSWSSTLLEKSSMREDQMPRLVEGSEVSGQLRQDLARSWGMQPTVVVAGGGADNAAAACGVGIAQPGSAFVSLGTSGVVLASNDGFRPNADSAVHAFCHAIPNVWYQMGVILSATASLEWFSSLVSRPASELTGALGSELREPASVSFLPYLTGERTPHNDARARGVFLGIDPATNQEDLTQSIIEGVTFALCDGQKALDAAGTQLSSVMAVGGGSRSDYWLKLIATAMNLPVDVPEQGDFGAAFGAARLGMCASGQDSPLSICRQPVIQRRIEPDRSKIQAFGDAYQKWRQLYPAVSAVMSEE